MSSSIDVTESTKSDGLLYRTSRGTSVCHVAHFENFLTVIRATLHTDYSVTMRFFSLSIHAGPTSERGLVEFWWEYTEVEVVDA